MSWQDMHGLADFREQARTWLAANVITDPRPTDGPAVREYDSAWLSRCYEGGWSGIDWAPQYGGRGLSLLEQVIWYEELVNAGAPGLGVFGVAFGHAGPTIMMCGDAAQKQYFLPPILRGETPWCQGFSEPSAGSDLASLRTRGEVDGDTVVITGQKTWTSYGQWAVYGELLVRTAPDLPRHKGLSWLVVDMQSPGIDIRPIAQMDGRSEFCEVFFDEVRVPLENVVGGVDNGWSVAMSTLAAERGPAFLDLRLTQIRRVDELAELAADRGLLADAAFAQRVALLRAEAAALRGLAYLTASTTVVGSPPGPETTAMRTFYTQFQINAGRLAVDILGQSAIVDSEWTRYWLGQFAGPIAGGTKDIQKNIIAERVLGLPR